MSPFQCAMLALAAQVGAVYNVPKLPHLVMQESSACIQLIGDDGLSFGCAQMQAHTALEIISAHPEMWHKGRRLTAGRVTERLLNDPEWAMQMAAVHIKDVGLRAYNAGVRGAELGRGHGYLGKLEKRSTDIKACEVKKELRLRHDI